MCFHLFYFFLLDPSWLDITITPKIGHILLSSFTIIWCSFQIPDFVSDVEGDILVPNSKHSQDPRQPDFNTLDEPIKQTVMRDLKAVCIKFKYVLFPRDKESQLLLKEWDLWGPLMLCTFMAVYVLYIKCFLYIYMFWNIFKIIC